MPGAKLDPTSMARRAAQEVRAGEAVAVGSGLPIAIPSDTLPSTPEPGCLSESGAVGYRPGSSGMAVDAAGGQVALIPGGTVAGVCRHRRDCWPGGTLAWPSSRRHR